MLNVPWKSIKLLCFAVLSVMLMCGCDDEYTEFEYGLAWTADYDYSEQNAVVLTPDFIETDDLVLIVDLVSINNGLTHGLYFDVVFRDEVMDFTGFEPGTVLENSGQVNYQMALDPQDPGRLIVGISLVGQLAVESANGPAVYLTFEPSRTGTCPFSFENARILTSEGAGTVPVTGISWYGGYATIE